MDRDAISADIDVQMIEVGGQLLRVATSQFDLCVPKTLSELMT